MSEETQAPAPVEAPDNDPADAIVRRFLIGALVLLVLGIALVGAGYLAGNAGPGADEVTAECGGAGRQMTCSLGDEGVVGWTGGRGGVDWADEDGKWHEGGRPDCIPRDGKAEVTLGVVKWDHDDVESVAVLWVDCQE